MSRWASSRRGAAGTVAAALLTAPWGHARVPVGAGPGPLVAAIHSQAPNIGTRAILTAIDAYAQVRRRHLTAKPIVTIVDCSLPSNRRRLAVADVQTGKVLFYTYVAHGKGSGTTFATRFSNDPGTDASSIGVFLTGGTYYGKHG